MITQWHLSYVPSSVSSRASPPCLCESRVFWRLSSYMNSSSKPFDQVVWPTTRSRPIVNVSMCLLLCVVFSFLNRINGPVMKLTVRWLTLFSNLEMRPIGRESLNKQNLLCFYPHAHTHRHTIRQPLTGLCQNTAQNKAHRAVWATVKCYGLNGNWQSGWARLSKAICELEEQSRRQRGVFFVF